MIEAFEELYPTVVAGDSLVIGFSLQRQGAELVAPPTMHYAVRANPLFSPYRDPTHPLSGTVAGDSVGASIWSGPTSIWAFDLPDEDFLYPATWCTITSRVRRTSAAMYGRPPCPPT